MSPLFAPVPGGPELLIVLLVMAVIYLAISLLVIVAIFYFLGGRRGSEQWIARLERRVEKLENE